MSHPRTAQSPAVRALEVRRSPGVVYLLRSSQLQPWFSSGIILQSLVTMKEYLFPQQVITDQPVKVLSNLQWKAAHKVCCIFSDLADNQQKIQGQNPNPQPSSQGGCHRQYMTVFCLIKCLFCLIKCLLPCTISTQLQGWMSWSYLCAMSKDCIGVWRSFLKQFLKSSVQIPCWRWQKQKQLTIHLLKNLCTVCAI